MSALIPREFITELIARTDIVELIDERIPLKKAGRNYHACCPFHEEKTPSFSVSSSKQFYHCFGCGVSGNAVGFLIAYENKTFPEAVESLAKTLGMTMPALSQQSEHYKNHKITNFYEPLQKSSEHYQQALKKSPKAMAYLKSRGLSDEIVKKYRIGYAPDKSNAGYDAFHGRIVFPIHDRQGQVTGFGGRVIDSSQQPKYLNSPESPVFHKSHVLYGLYEARQASIKLDKMLVVEGYMDVVSLAQAGITFCAATLGTATTSQHINQLFQQVSQIIFCFDGDSAGKKAAWRALEAALSTMRDDCQIKFLFLPDDEDPDTLIKKIGKDNFLLQLEQNTQTLADFFFQHLKAQTDLHSVEGRTKLLSLALPYIDAIASPIFQEMMKDKLAEIVRFEKSRFYLLIKNTQKALAQGAENQKIQRTPMRLAIGLALQHPHLIADCIAKNPAGYVNLINADSNLQGSQLLKEILIVLKNPSAFTMTTANILEYFRDKTDISLLYKLAAWEHGVPENGIAAEWEGILMYIQKNQHNQQIEKYIKKSHQERPLTEAEKRELQHLFLDKKAHSPER